MTDLDNPNAFIAYEILEPDSMPLRPASTFRDWMDQTQLRYAYRCLPLIMANQFGWTIGSPCGFSVRWDGAYDPGGIAFSFEDQNPSTIVSSLFGHGIVTFNMPCVFRTPQGINLHVKGPANMPKDGISPLEGVVESDWSTSTFTMNWKFTRPHHSVSFARGEPICCVIPSPRHLLASLSPVSTPITAHPAVHANFRQWSQERDAFHARMHTGDPEALTGWQKDYFQGHEPGIEKFAEHQTQMSLRPFLRSG